MLLGTDGRVVLTDFGIAMVEGDPALTASGMLVGSPAFMAPERVQGKGTGPESDLWSLGATLYTAVEGRAPHDRGAPLPTVAAVVTEAADPPRLAGPLWPIIEGLLRKNPAERLSAEEAEHLLRGVASAVGQEAQAPPERQRPAGLSPTVTDHGAGDGVHGRDGQAGRDGWRTSPPAVPAGEPGRRRAIAAAAVAVALLAALGLGWATLSWSEDPDGRAGQPAANTTRSGQPSTPGPTRSTSPSSPLTTRQSQPTSRPPSKPPSVPSTRPIATLPTGFTRYRDQTGFSLAVPAGWNVTRQGGRVYFREPEGSRLLIIDQTDDPQPNPVADWEQQEEARRDGYPDYRRIRIAPVDYFQKAADWEFTYAGGRGPVHVLIRGTVTSAQRAYGIYWSTPDSRWQDNLRYWRTFTATFRPAT